MGLLCFVFDLASLAPPSLALLTTSLLHLENLYATKSRRTSGNLNPLVSSGTTFNASINIAICGIDKTVPDSTSYEIRVIYKPSGSLNLRDFHHAVNNLHSMNNISCTGIEASSVHCGQGHFLEAQIHVTDRPVHLVSSEKRELVKVSFILVPNLNVSSFGVSCLGALILSKDGLLSWGSQNSCKKVVMISSLFTEKMESFRSMLMEAADHCIAIDFIQISPMNCFDESLNLTMGSSEKISLPDLATNIGEFENCSFRQIPCDIWQFASLEKQWFQDMLDDVEGPIEVTLLFQLKLYNETDKVFCSLRPLHIQLTDIIQPCRTCRCHGAILGTNTTEISTVVKETCPYTEQELDDHDVNSNSIKIGSQDVLYFPLSKNPIVEPEKSLNITKPPLTFTVLKCIHLSTLSEGLLFGDPYHMVPSSEVDLDDDVETLEINDAVFSTLCEGLHANDYGLLCSSTFDVNSLKTISFPCYYLLLPAENRTFLVKRIAASEEFLKISCPELRTNAVQPELRDSIISCLSKIDVENYNPLNHERGLHTKLNWLVKESLQMRCPNISKPMSSQRMLRTVDQKSPVENHDSDIGMGLKSYHDLMKDAKQTTTMQGGSLLHTFQSPEATHLAARSESTGFRSYHDLMQNAKKPTTALQGGGSLHTFQSPAATHPNNGMALPEATGISIPVSRTRKSTKNLNSNAATSRMPAESQHMQVSHAMGGYNACLPASHRKQPLMPSSSTEMPLLRLKTPIAELSSLKANFRRIKKGKLC